LDFPDAKTLIANILDTDTDILLHFKKILDEKQDLNISSSTFDCEVYEI